MAVIHNDVFRMVNLRGAAEGVVIDPSEDARGSIVVELLADLEVDVRVTDPDVIGRIASIDIEEPAVAELAGVFAAIAAASNGSAGPLAHLPVDFRGTTTPLHRLAASNGFGDAYRSAYDTWLSRRLQGQSVTTPIQIENALRAARIAVLAGRASSSLDLQLVGRLLRAQISVPRTWKGGYRRRREADARRAGVSDAATSDSALETKIAASTVEYEALTERIVHLENVQSKAHRLYRQKLAARAGRPAPTTTTVSPARGVLARFSRFVLGAPSRTFDRIARTPLALDAAFRTELDAALSEAESRALGEATDSSGGGTVAFSRFGDFEANVNAVVIADADKANDLCQQIRALTEQRTNRLPRGATPSADVDRPSINALGWGELVVAREKLVGYTANEIAHIENVVAGETKVREHTRRRTVAELIETETSEETESERELESTDRHELQIESSKAIDEEFSIDAGVNTSGRYGLTKVDTSLDVGLQRSQQEARQTTTNVAKEIVSRAVERTFTSTRTLRRLTTTDETSELNRHTLDNAAVEGGPTPVDVSGLYLWVQKIHEVELRHYGTRLMVEFHIPEPAISVLGYDKNQASGEPPPPPFDISAGHIGAGNYQCLAKVFKAVGIEPPPQRFIEVGFAWASTPDEKANDDKAEDTVATLIAIPAGFQPVSATGIASALPIAIADFSIYIALGGKDLIDSQGLALDTGDVDWDDDDGSWPWPQGVPFSLLAHGHYDKTLIAHVNITCERTDDAYKAWQIKTWQALREGHDRLVAEYEEREEQARFEAGTFAEIGIRPAAINRRTEQEELEKWAVKILRAESLDFRAVVDEGGHPEVGLVAADTQAPLVQFYEEAFEWPQMSYFFYPYFWGRRDAWRFRQSLSDPDQRFQSFLRAGAAKVIVPVTPGYEERVLFYLDSPEIPEVERIKGPPAPVSADDMPVADSEHTALWLELLLDRNDSLMRGSGLIELTPDSDIATLHQSGWIPSERDLGRELYIDGDRYEVAVALPPDQIQLSTVYQGAGGHFKYGTGSVPFGSPWLVNQPTSLVILSGEVDKLPTKD